MFEFLSFLLGKMIFFTGAVLGKTHAFPPPLNKEEESDCLIRMKHGDKSARDELISRNMRLVAHVAKKYAGTADSDDLISVGSIGLIKAIDGFDAEKGALLATFAARCIENEILMLLRANKRYKNDLSLSDPVGADKDGNELTLMDLLYAKEDEVFSAVDKSIEREKLVSELKRILSDREYKVICLRYGLKGNKSFAQREVAAFLKISRSYISRIEKKAIEKIREEVKKGNFNC